ncbi:Serine/threonine-protein kinase PDIK1L [Turdus rufiventris]|nr:Serine/threonine-protein kinase PDIK1L [Turdus rufiventris]
MAEEEAKYSILREAGRDSYGLVYEAVANRTEQRVAVKRMPCNTPENAELALQEFWALQSIQQQHQNIIQLEERVLQRDRVCQPLEHRESGSHLLLGGTVNEFLLARGPDARLNGRFVRQLSGAVAFLHRHRIAHRDLKADNILVASGPGGPVVKRFSSPCGSSFCVAPELWDSHSTAKADIFALGVIFWATAERITFRDSDSGRQLLGISIRRGVELIPLGEALLENPSLKLQIPVRNKESLPEDLCQLLQHMLAFNPKERLDAAQLETQIRQISYGKKRCGA